MLWVLVKHKRDGGCFYIPCYFAQNVLYCLRPPANRPPVPSISLFIRTRARAHSHASIHCAERAEQTMELFIRPDWHQCSMSSPRRDFIEAVDVQTVQTAKRDILHIDLVYTQFKRVKRNTLFGIVASCF